MPARPMGFGDNGEAGSEAEHASGRGAGNDTPLALLLLAGLVLRRGDRRDEALKLAAAALELDTRRDAPVSGALRALHAALIVPLAATLGQAAGELAGICEQDGAPSCAFVYLAGTAFAAGMPLPELSRRLERAAGLAGRDKDRGATAAELAARAHLLAGLLRGGAGAPHHPAAPTAPHEERFGHWLTMLQSAWYADDSPRALQAVERAGALACPAVPLGDRISFHVFAALALSQSGDAGAGRKLDRHCAALRRLALHFPDCAGSFSALAEAARLCRTGPALDALRACEEAGEAAGRQGRHWVAALAWERAAESARGAGLASIVSHYRRLALARYADWGALGRIDALRRSWGDQEADAGELGLSIAHEVNQPLAAICLHAAAARRWLRRPEPDLERALSSIALIGDAGRHAGDIVRSVQRFAAHHENAMGPVDADQAIRDVLQLLQHRMCTHGIEVDLALGLDGRTIHADRTQLRQVVTNLLVNAIEALSGVGAQASKRIRVTSRPAGEHDVEIAVADNGPGIPAEHRERVFGTMFSSKPGSTGMGLSISRAIVLAHGGCIGYEPAAPQGACFRFRLPAQGGRHD